MSFIKYLKENMEHFDYISGEDDIESEDADAAYTMAKDAGINILRDKELDTIVKEKSVGDIAEINVPNGIMKFEVITISR